MNSLQSFKEFSDGNQWLVIWPEIALALVAVLLLVLELLRPARKGRASLPGRFARLSQALILIFFLLDFLVWRPSWDRSIFSGLLSQGFRSDIMRSLFLLSSLLVSIIGEVYLRRRNLPRGEFHGLVMLASAALMLLAQSSHFLMIFMALEAAAVCFFVLVGYRRASAKSLEAGMKYLIFGALSSSLFLFGIVLLYGVAIGPEAWGCQAIEFGSGDPLEFHYLGEFIALNAEHPLLRAGVVLVISGIAFKIGAAPFQIWVPDVYHGAPTPVTCFLLVSSKAAGFFLLLNLVNGPFESLVDFLAPLLGVVATLTIFFGNLAALTQRNVKRMLGLSGVAHAGYMLVGVIASMYFPGDSDRATWAVIFYLFAYLLASFGTFGVMCLARHPGGDAEQDLEHYAGFGRKRPFLAFVLTVGQASRAGLPISAGFVAKLLLFAVAFQAKLYLSLVAMVVGVVISMYYYFGWIREALFDPPPPFSDEEVIADPWAGADPDPTLKLTLFILTAALLVLGLWQGPLGDVF